MFKFHGVELAADRAPSSAACSFGAMSSCRSERHIERDRWAAPRGPADKPVRPLYERLSAMSEPRPKRWSRYVRRTATALALLLAGFALLFVSFAPTVASPPR